jgi:hypothetical protein
LVAERGRSKALGKEGCNVSYHVRSREGLNILVCDTTRLAYHRGCQLSLESAKLSAPTTSYLLGESQRELRKHGSCSAVRVRGEAHRYNIVNLGQAYHTYWLFVKCSCRWDKGGMAIPFRGATAVGNGKHILTGPIYICDAQPGDKVKVREGSRIFVRV